MTVTEPMVREHGASAAIVLACLLYAAQGAPVVLARTDIARSTGLHRLTVARALERLHRSKAIRVERIPRKKRLVIHVKYDPLTCLESTDVERSDPTRRRSKVGARLDGIRGLLDLMS